MPPKTLHKTLAISAMTCVKYNNGTRNCSNATPGNDCIQCINGEYNATLRWRTPNITATVTKYTVRWGPESLLFTGSVRRPYGEENLPPVRFYFYF